MNARTLSVLTSAVVAVLLTGCPKAPEPVVPPTPPEITRFEVSATNVSAGDSVTLSWAVEHAETIELTRLGGGPVLGEVPAEGEQPVTIEDDSVFVLSVRGEGGEDARAVRVSVGTKEPVALLGAVPEQIAAGGSATLIYSSPGATSLALLDDANAPVPVGEGDTGTVVVSPRFTTAYRLEASGKTANATVTVTPGILSLTAVRLPGDAPRKVLVSWQAGGADLVALSAAGEELFQTEARPTIAQGSYEHTLEASVPADASIEYTLFVGEGDARVQQSVSVRVGGIPAIDAFVVPTYAREGGSIALSWQTRGATRAEVWQGTTQLFEATKQQDVTNGSIVIDSPTAATSYELRVFDAEGQQATASGTTEPLGAVSLVKFEADQTAITQGGEAVVLEWNVPNARRMRITQKNRGIVHGATGVAAESGTVTVYPNEASVEYILTADNTVGDSLNPAPSATVTVASIISAGNGVVTAPESLPNAFGPPLPEAQYLSTTVPNVVAVEGMPVVVKNVPGDAFVDLRGRGVKVPFSATEDTWYEDVSLPEPFTSVVYGSRLTNVTTALVSANGWFTLSTSTFGSTGPDDNVAGLPQANLDKLAIAPYFDDLVMTPEAEVRVDMEGEGRERRVIVQWTNVSHQPSPGSRLTFQAQVFGSGKIVFAYQKVEGVRDASASIGVQDSSETLALLAPDQPVSGDSYTFFGPTATPPAHPVPYVGYFARLRLSDGGALEFNAKPPVLATKQFGVSEVNFGSGSGVTAGEWIEVTSTSTAAHNLRGWTLGFGKGQRHTISQDVILPPGGQVLLAQSPGAGDGLTVDYVYGAAFDLSELSGEVSLLSGGFDYDTLAWSYGEHGGPGVSWRFEPKGKTGWVYNSSAPGLYCTGTTPYGSNGQLGTPLLPDTGCFPYTYGGSAPGTFDSLRLSGGKSLTVTQPRGEVFEVSLPFPIRIGHREATILYVSSNGFLTMDPLVCVPTSSGCFSSNTTSPNPSSDPIGTVAVFWDAFNLNTSTPGIFWDARDPDGIADSGDEVVIVSWENMKLYNSTPAFTSDLNFQVHFFANGKVEYRFGTMTASGVTAAPNMAKGSGATTWLEEPGGRGALKVNANSPTAPGIAPNTSHVFTWAP